jgi:hypothetical protein
MKAAMTPEMAAYHSSGPFMMEIRACGSPCFRKFRVAGARGAGNGRSAFARLAFFLPMSHIGLHREAGRLE